MIPRDRAAALLGHASTFAEDVRAARNAEGAGRLADALADAEAAIDHLRSVLRVSVASPARPADLMDALIRTKDAGPLAAGRE